MTEIDVSKCEHYWNTHNLELCKINFDNNYYSNGLPLAEKCSFKDCYYKQMKRLEQENNKLKTQYNCYACGSCKGKEDYINLEKHHKGLRTEFDRLHREIRRLKWYLNEIRYQELATLDIDWDEYETGRRDTEYTNIINLVQEALDEVSEEECRYHRYHREEKQNDGNGC